MTCCIMRKHCDNGCSTLKQMDKRLDNTVKKRDVDTGLALATNLSCNTVGSDPNIENIDTNVGISS